MAAQVNPAGGDAAPATANDGGNFAEMKAFSEQLTAQQKELAMLNIKERFERGPVERTNDSAKQSKLA